MNNMGELLKLTKYVNFDDTEFKVFRDVMFKIGRNKFVLNDDNDPENSEIVFNSDDPTKPGRIIFDNKNKKFIFNIGDELAETISLKDIPDFIPSLDGNDGKFLTNDGNILSWGNIVSTSTLPTQTGQAGKILETDGTQAFWSPKENITIFDNSNSVLSATNLQDAITELDSRIINDVKRINNNYAMTNNDSVLIIDASNNNIVITLPNAETVDKKIFYLKRINDGSNLITINSLNNQTIDDTSSRIYLTERFTNLKFVSDGTNWYLL